MGITCFHIISPGLVQRNAQQGLRFSEYLLCAPHSAPSRRKPFIKLSPAFTPPPLLVLVLRPLFSQYFGHSILGILRTMSLPEHCHLNWTQKKLCLCMSCTLCSESNAWHTAETQEYYLSQTLHKSMCFQISFMCSLGCLKCSFLFKIQKDLYTSEEFLCDMTWLCINLHIPAKTRKRLQLSKFFFSVSKLRLLTNRRRYHFHSSS